MLRRRPSQFSLLSLLLIVTIAGITVSHVVTSMKNRSLAARIREQQRLIREQNDQLRQLTVDDPEQVHIINTSEIWPDGKVFLNARPPATLCWDLHFPPNSRWKIYWAKTQIPQADLPSQRLGGQLLTVPTGLNGRARVLLHEDESLAIWRFQFAYERQEWLADLTREEAAWLREKSPVSWEAVGGDQYRKPFTESFAPDHAIVLLRIRRMIETGPSTVQDDPNPCEGFMIWFEPQPDRR